MYEVLVCASYSDTHTLVEHVNASLFIVDRPGLTTFREILSQQYARTSLLYSHVDKAQAAENFDSVPSALPVVLTVQ